MADLPVRPCCGTGESTFWRKFMRRRLSRRAVLAGTNALSAAMFLPGGLWSVFTRWRRTG